MSTPIEQEHPSRMSITCDAKQLKKQVVVVIYRQDMKSAPIASENEGKNLHSRRVLHLCSISSSLVARRRDLKLGFSVPQNRDYICHLP